MSDKLSMPACDKVTTRIQVRATTFVRLESLQQKLGLKSMNAIINAGLDEFVKDVPFGKKESERLDEIIKNNVAARDAAKLAKGISKASNRKG